MKKILKVFTIVFLIITIFALSLSQRADQDMYGHIAAGNIIAHHGLINQDLLISQRNEHYEWIPFEWGFEYVLYEWISHFGFSSYGLFIALGSLVQASILYLLLRRALSFDFRSTIISSLFYIFIEYNFLVARPQLFGMSFLLGFLFLIFLYIKKNRNFLYILVPISYVWANLHGSVVFGIMLCLIYSILCFIYAYIAQMPLWIKKAKMIVLSALGMTIASILPPQGFMQYRILANAFKYIHMLQIHNEEWGPFDGSWKFLIYLLVTVPILLAALWRQKKDKTSSFLLLLPIMGFIPYGLTAERNMYFGYLGSTILLGTIISQLKLSSVFKKLAYWGSIIIILFVALLISSNNFILVNSLLVYPRGAADFIQKEHIQGNMFNQFYYGGYLEYRLYPNVQVFADGRTDLNSCCKIADYNNILDTIIFSPKQTAIAAINKFFNFYNISYVVLSYKNDYSAAVLSNILTSNPGWVRIFKDSDSVIFIKKNGKNPKLTDGY